MSTRSASHAGRLLTVVRSGFGLGSRCVEGAEDVLEAGDESAGDGDGVGDDDHAVFACDEDAGLLHVRWPFGRDGSGWRW